MEPESPPMTVSVSAPEDLVLRCLGPREYRAGLPAVERFLRDRGPLALSQHPGMLTVLEEGLGHEVYLLLAERHGQVSGCLPLAHVRSLVFGRFLVGLPYVNTGGVVAGPGEAARRLIDAAVELANRLRVRYLELRHERPVEHPALIEANVNKVHMRLELPATSEELWSRLHSKVRNQVRKGMKHELTVLWGGEDLLPEFYAVFSRNMRDLGTPVYGRSLFQSLLRVFGDRAELCVIRQRQAPLAAAVCLHGWGISEVPSASSLREHNSTNANMLLYWNLLERAVCRGQAQFDFGRSTVGSNTHRFKQQWGAREFPAVWQHHLRHGSSRAVRPDNPRYGMLIRCWQRLPVWVTRLLGPPLIRGIP